MTDHSDFSIDDLRNLVGLASTVEDRTPEEAASLDRVGSHLDKVAPGWDDLIDVDGRQELRRDVRAALAAWAADRSSVEREDEYFGALTALDCRLAELGLERGDDIDVEVPLGTSTHDTRAAELSSWQELMEGVERDAPNKQRDNGWSR